MNGRTKYVAISILAIIELALISYGLQRKSSHESARTADATQIPSATVMTQYHQPAYVESADFAPNTIIWESSPAIDGYLVVEPHVEYPAQNQYSQSPQPVCQCGPQIVMSFPTATEQPPMSAYETFAPIESGTIIYESSPVMGSPVPFTGEIVYEQPYVAPSSEVISPSQPTTSSQTSGSWVMVPTNQMPQYVEQHYPGATYKPMVPTVVESQPVIVEQAPVLVEQAQPIGSSTIISQPTATYYDSYQATVGAQSQPLPTVITSQPTIVSSQPIPSTENVWIEHAVPTNIAYTGETIVSPMAPNTFVANPAQQTYTSNSVQPQYPTVVNSSVIYSYPSESGAIIYSSIPQNVSHCDCDATVVYESSVSDGQIVTEGAAVESPATTEINDTVVEPPPSDSDESPVVDPVPEIEAPDTSTETKEPSPPPADTASSGSEASDSNADVFDLLEDTKPAETTEPKEADAPETPTIPAEANVEEPAQPEPNEPAAETPESTEAEADPQTTEDAEGKPEPATEPESKSKEEPAPEADSIEDLLKELSEDINEK